MVVMCVGVGDAGEVELWWHCLRGQSLWSASDAAVRQVEAAGCHSHVSQCLPACLQPVTASDTAVFTRSAPWYMPADRS